jgi:hypothetical protein
MSTESQLHEKLRKIEAPVEMQFSMPDQWSRSDPFNLAEAGD